MLLSHRPSIPEWETTQGRTVVSHPSLTHVSLAPASLLGPSVPSAGTALPHSRHTPGKAAAIHFWNKSPLHPKSERIHSNFPKKVTVRIHLFSRFWHRTLYFIKVWSLCLPVVGQIYINLCKLMNGHHLLQTGISSMAISTKKSGILDAFGSGFFLLTCEVLLRFLTLCSL